MKKHLNLPILFFFIFLFLIPSQAFSWGMIGHRIVGEIAEAKLSKKELGSVRKSLDGQTLAQVANWADFIRSDANFNRLAPLHYVSLAEEDSYESSSRNPEGDIIQALFALEEILTDSTLNHSLKKQALMFYVHLMGDLHQPLHAGYPKDRGGNGIEISWFGLKSNLHKLWDEDLIESEKLSYTEYAHLLLTPNPQFKRVDPKKESYLTWAFENRTLLPGLYEGLSGNSWSYNYRYRHESLLNESLLKGGLHLGERLKAIFQGQRSKGFEAPAFLKNEVERLKKDLILVFSK